MGKGKKVPGKDSGVTADDIGKSPDVSKPPGKTNLVQAQEVGDPYIDHGAVCEGTDGSGTGGCFLSDRQRDKLIGDFKLWTINALTNYKIALEALRVDELMKKEEDLPWVLSLALDVAGHYVVNAAIKAVQRLRSGGIERLMNEAIGGPPAYQTRMGRSLAEALEGVSPEKITTRIKQGGDWASKKAKAYSKTVLNGEERNSKQVSLAYLARLSVGVDVSFRDFIRNSTGTATDAELVVLWEGMQPEHHDKEMYKGVLADKLKRFKQSGVATIGRLKASDGGEFKRADVIRDKRVVWVLSEDGRQRSLWFQKHEASYNPSVIHRGDDPAMDEQLYGPQTYKFGDRGGKVAQKPDSEVPREFWNEAVEISEEKWGPTRTLKQHGDTYVPYTDISAYQPHRIVQDDPSTNPPAGQQQPAGTKAADKDLLAPGSPASPVRTDVRGYDAQKLTDDVMASIQGDTQ